MPDEVEHVGTQLPVGRHELRQGRAAQHLGDTSAGAKPGQDRRDLLLPCDVVVTAADDDEHAKRPGIGCGRGGERWRTPYPRVRRIEEEPLSAGVGA